MSKERSHAADVAQIRPRMLAEYGIKIGGGLGAFKGKAWRIGLMGESATRRHVTTALEALETILQGVGAVPRPGAALAAAEAAYGA